MTMYSNDNWTNKNNAGRHSTEANWSVKPAYRAAPAIRCILQVRIIDFKNSSSFQSRRVHSSHKLVNVT